MKFRPPKLAAYWSCLPIGIFSLSISTWQARSATSWRLMRTLHSTAIALISATATVLDDPSPVPGGTCEARKRERPVQTPKCSMITLGRLRSPSQIGGPSRGCPGEGPEDAEETLRGFLSL